MPVSQPTLRNLLLVDAATCAAMGGFLMLGSDVVGHLMQIPAELLFYAGLSLLPIAAFMALVAMRPAIHAPAVWLIIVGNALWVLGSLLLLFAGWMAPNHLGVGFIVAQALVVAMLARLEHGALRGTLLRPRTS